MNNSRPMDSLCYKIDKKLRYVTLTGFKNFVLFDINIKLYLFDLLFHIADYMLIWIKLSKT